MIRSRALFAVALLVLATTASAQFVQTGNVQADFPAANQFADPGGIDVGVPPLLAGNVSGWDMENVALLYDELTDTLHVGIDVFDPMGTTGIAGDADGDGDPGMSSSGLVNSGGIDRPDMEGTESFTFGLDLDADGNLDVIAGLPIGQDINGYTVALFNGSIFAPFLAFGAALPMNTGTVFASPSASAPDLEFTITNLSSLVAQFHQPGQTTIGIHAFMGSQEDDGIGEDYFPGLVTLPIPLPPCYPAPNLLSVLDIVPVTGPGGIQGERIVLSYGALAGNGCCGLVSPVIDAVGKTLTMLPGMPTINLGSPGTFADVLSQDFGDGNIPGRAVTCKEISGNLFGLPPGRAIHFQMLQYPIQFGTGSILTSNVVTYVAP